MQNTEFQEKYLRIIDENQEQEIRALQDLIRIKSVAVPTEGEYPFGEGVQKAYELFMNMAEAEGFVTKNVDNYGGHFEYGDGETVFGIVGHLDVVPEGKDWDYDPYGAEIADGKIFGRGTKDDKGPMVAAFYALKALKDAGFKPKKKIRVIIGLDEETNWAGMDYYVEKEGIPDFGISPDGDFPVIHGEQGILVFDLAKKLSGSKNSGKGLMLTGLKGGNAPNMVADNARAVIKADSYDDIKEIIKKYKEDTGYSVKFKGVGKSLEIITEGISAHGARPDMGLNAISIMMELLQNLPFEDENLREFIGFYNNHIGFKYHGENIEMAFSDDVSGKLMFNVGMVQADKEAIILTINVRYPVTMKEDEVYGGLIELIKRYDIGLVKEKHTAPIYMPKDSPLIQELMRIYKKHTGDETEPLVIGGGTYARSMKNAVAYGPMFPWEEDCNHQKNEHITIETLMLATKIYAEAIERLTESEEKFYE